MTFDSLGCDKSTLHFQLQLEHSGFRSRGGIPLCARAVSEAWTITLALRINMERACSSRSSRSAARVLWLVHLTAELRFATTLAPTPSV